MSTILKGIDCPGNDIISYSNKTYDQCVGLCKQNNKCTTIAYAPNGNECWLKTKADKLVQNSDRWCAPVDKSDQYSSDIGGRYVPSEAAYQKYEKELNGYNLSKQIKSTNTDADQLLSDLPENDTIAQTQMSLYKTKLQRQENQTKAFDASLSKLHNMESLIQQGYADQNNKKIRQINQLNRHIESSDQLITHNHASTDSKNRTIYALGNLLVLLLLVVVVGVCLRLGIISIRIAGIIIGVMSLLYLFKLYHKFYWNRSLSESDALKRFTEQTYQAVGSAMRDNLTPSWMTQRCPKRCKPKQQKIKHHPGQGKLPDEGGANLKTDSSINVWAGADPGDTPGSGFFGPNPDPEEYCCQELGSDTPFKSTIPCSAYVGHKQLPITKC